MSFKLLQFPPQASTRSMRVPVRWIELDECMGADGFLSSWLGDDKDPVNSRAHINWGAVTGLAISLVIGGGFWAVLGLMVARLLK